MSRILAITLFAVFLFASRAVADSSEDSSESSSPMPTEMPGQTSSPDPGTSMSPSGSDKPEKTSGIMGDIFVFLSPFTNVAYELFDTVLRNLFNQKLPCNIYSFMPLDIECTPVGKGQ